MNKFDDITKQGCIMYISSLVETYQDRIKQDDPRKKLYEERILFFEKTLELLKEDEQE